MKKLNITKWGLYFIFVVIIIDNFLNKKKIDNKLKINNASPNLKYEQEDHIIINKELIENFEYKDLEKLEESD